MVIRVHAVETGHTTGIPGASLGKSVYIYQDKVKINIAHATWFTEIIELFNFLYNIIVSAC